MALNVNVRNVSAKKINDSRDCIPFLCYTYCSTANCTLMTLLVLLIISLITHASADVKTSSYSALINDLCYRYFPNICGINDGIDAENAAPIVLRFDISNGSSHQAMSFYRQYQDSSFAAPLEIFIFIYSNFDGVVENNILENMRITNDYLIKPLESFQSLNNKWTKDDRLDASVKLIVSFSFNGEQIVFTHLQYLYPVVDLFLISEARYTFSGQLKPHLFIDLFARQFANFSDKIRYIIIESFPAMPNDKAFIVDHRYMQNRSIQDQNNLHYKANHSAIYYETWHREEYQRGIAAEFLISNFPTTKYLLFVVDVDEIISRKIMNSLRSYYGSLEQPTYLCMDFFYYNFNWMKKQKWIQPFIIRDSFIRNMTLHTIRTTQYDRTCVQKGGWHCSYCTSLDEIIRKIESFSHIEYNHEFYKKKELIQYKITNGLDIFDRLEDDEQLERADNLEMLPTELQSFQSSLELSYHLSEADNDRIKHDMLQFSLRTNITIY